jgi:hypothetical protein
VSMVDAISRISISQAFRTSLAKRTKKLPRPPKGARQFFLPFLILNS